MPRIGYAELMAFLTTREAAAIRTRRHRLPHEAYTWSDCEFFFTICARHLGTPFLDDALARAVIDALLWYRDKYQLQLFCYCLMPDHLHFILKLSDDLTGMRNGGVRGTKPLAITDIIGDFKSYTTTNLWWATDHRGKLWQRSSFDHVIRYNDSIEEAVGYTLINPVRKGLAEEWPQYPYAGIADEW